MIDAGLFQNATQMELDVLSAMHFIAEVDNTHYKQELLCEVWFLK
jgi:hypothetical protein